MVHAYVLYPAFNVSGIVAYIILSPSVAHEFTYTFNYPAYGHYGDVTLANARINVHPVEFVFVLWPLFCS